MVSSLIRANGYYAIRMKIIATWIVSTLIDSRKALDVVDWLNKHVLKPILGAPNIFFTRAFDNRTDLRRVHKGRGYNIKTDK
jgi:hypothetical protein